MKESPSAVPGGDGQFTCGHGVTWRWQDTPLAHQSLSPDSAVHSLTPFLQCPIQNQGSFCGADLQLMRILCFLQKSAKNSAKKSQRFIFFSEHPSVCAHAQSHMSVCVAVGEIPGNCFFTSPFPSDHSPGQDSQGAAASNQLYWKTCGFWNNQKD